jgi:restriction endonuclease BglII
MLESLIEKGFEVRSESHASAILEQDFPTAVGEIEKELRAFEIPITEIIGSGGGETHGTRRLRRALTAQGWNKTIFQVKKNIQIREKRSRIIKVELERDSATHEIDHVKLFSGANGSKLVALEIEWNNKDPFFDRDLENFKRLHSEGAISAGIIITRGSSLQKNIRDYVYRYAAEQNIQSFADLDRLKIEITGPKRNDIRTRTTREKNPISFTKAWTDNFIKNKYGESQTHWAKLMTRVERGVGNPCPLLLIGLPDSIVKFDVDPVVEPVEVEEENEEPEAPEELI